MGFSEKGERGRETIIHICNMLEADGRTETAEAIYAYLKEARKKIFQDGMDCLEKLQRFKDGQDKEPYIL